MKQVKKIKLLSKTKVGVTLQIRESYQADADILLDLVINPEEYLKKGRTCTVYANSQFVVKRYNQKTWLHRIKQILGLGRAKTTFELTTQLYNKRIAVSEPVAYGFKKCLGVKLAEYFIAKRLEGQTLAQILEDPNRPEWEKRDYIMTTIDFLHILWMADWVHGDLKTPNIMIVDDKAFFIDLDGMQIGSKEGLEKDKQRFLKNFIETSFYDDVKTELLID